MQISYCEQWSRGYAEPHTPLTEKQAAQRHRGRRLYTALIGPTNKPTCFLEFSEYRSVGVEFLDSAQRTYRDYSFQEKKPGQLFLSMVRIPGFPHETGPPNRATVFYYKTDGNVSIVRYEAYPTGVGSYIAGSEERQVDVSHNWETHPEFGEYDSITRFDRGIPLIDEVE